MHPRVYQEFETICSKREMGDSVLEIGSIPSEESLLCMKSLGNVTEKIGINLDGPHTFCDFQILKGNSNTMDCFEDESFDSVLCNATLEHDKFFWKTIAEIRRVTKPGGTIVIGTPGYKYYKAEKIKPILRKIPLVRNLSQNQYLDLFFSSTTTLEFHADPGDYYRFSPQAFREVFFEDLENVEVHTIMMPPRIIGVGTKKHH